MIWFIAFTSYLLHLGLHIRLEADMTQQGGYIQGVRGKEVTVERLQRVTSRHPIAQTLYGLIAPLTTA